nr:MAG TPA: hypothetical protein [Caudoviricetes sp.]
MQIGSITNHLPIKIKTLSILKQCKSNTLLK